MSRRTYFKSAQFSVEKDLKGYENFISTLEKKIEERSNSPESQYNFMLTEKGKFLKLNYAEDLKRQMAIKKQQRDLERLEMARPAISEDFHGYPNLPQTPPNVRRQRELDKMRKVSSDLSTQLIAKRAEVLTFRSTELETAKKSNIDDVLKHEQDRLSKLQKKENEKSMLVNAWTQAQRAKELQNILEQSDRKGLNPKTVRNSENSESVIQKKHAEDEASQINFENEVVPELQGQSLKESFPLLDQKRFLKEKAAKLKESLDLRHQGSYQYKIKQLVEEAKKRRGEARNNVKGSFSPNSRLPTDLSSKHLYISQRALKFK